MIAPNGSAYVEVQSWNYLEGCAEPPCWGTATLSYQNHLQLLEVRPDGVTERQTLKEHTYDGPLTNPAVNSLPWFAVGEVIPDGQGGLLAAWTYVQNVYDYYARTTQARVTRVSPSGLTEYSLPLPYWVSWWWWPWNPPYRSLALGEDGVAFGTNGERVLSFEVASGAVRWTWQPPSGEAELVAATAGNGLVVKDGGRVVRIDSNGVATYDEWTGGAPGAGATLTAAIDPATLSQLDYAWGRQWLALQTSPNPGRHPVAISAAAILWPWSIWPSPGIEDTRASIGPVEVRVFKVQLSNASDQLIRDLVHGAIEYWKEKRILLDWKNNEAIQIVTNTSLLNIDSQAKLDAVRAELAQFGDRVLQKGVNLVLTEGLAYNGVAYTPSTSGVFWNISLFPADVPAVLLTHLSLKLPRHVVAHEIGHTLQLWHVIPSEPLLEFTFASFNLMCGSGTGMGAFEEFFNDILCNQPLSFLLTDDQLRTAMETAETLKE